MPQQKSTLFGGKKRKRRFNTKTKHTKSDGRNFYGTSKQRQQLSSQKHKQKKKYDKFKNSVIEANADKIDALDKQIELYKDKIKQLKESLSSTTEQLRTNTAALWKLQDTFDRDSGEIKKDGDFIISHSQDGKSETIQTFG